MSNDHIKSDIGLYLSGGLTESRNRQIEAHAAACDKCRGALAKARAKQARIKREALKKAEPDSMPNLFLARQGKESGVARAPSKGPWITVGVLLVAGGSFWAFKQSSYSFHSSVLPTSDPTLAVLETSSAVVTNDKPVPTPAPAEKAVEPEVKKAPPKPPVAVPVLQEWKGAESSVQEPRVVVVRKKEAWEKLWTESQISGPLPEVDFNRQLVMGVFAGARPIGSSIGMGKIMEADDVVYAPYHFKIAAVQVSSTTVQAYSHPYLFSLVARVDKKIRLSQEEAPR